MNAEIYFPRNGKAFGQTSERSFEVTIKKLTAENVNIIYKTEINLTEDSIKEALRVSDSGEEKIGMIFIADALSEDDPDKAKEFFESIGVIGKVNKLESEWFDPIEETAQEPDYEDEEEDEEEKPSKKQKKKKKGKDKSNEEETIDISKVLVSVERKPFYAYTAEYNGKFILLLPEHESLDTNFISVLYTAAKKSVVPKKKRSFWKRIIPCKGDGPFDVVRKIILILAICTFLVSSYMLINILLIEPAINDKTTSSIRNLLVSTDENETSQPKKNTDGSDGILSDFSKLLETNPDTVGWITVPNTVIDYVVVQSPEDAQNAAHTALEKHKARQANKTQQPSLQDRFNDRREESSEYWKNRRENMAEPHGFGTSGTKPLFPLDEMNLEGDEYNPSDIKPDIAKDGMPVGLVNEERLSQIVKEIIKKKLQ